MNSKYHLVTIEPELLPAFSAASGGADILFDWHAMEIPRGTCIIKSVSGIVHGINGAAGNGVDFSLYFAKSINGAAPASFGTAHAAQTATISAAFRKNIISFMYLDLSSIDDADNLVGYNVIGSRSAASGDITADGGFNSHVMLQGDDAYGSTEGYQTIWVAGMAEGVAIDFGTDVDLNMGGNQAASTAAVQITTDSTDPRKCFQPGDKLQGETGTVTMEVVSVDSATTMTVKNVSAQIDDDEQLILQSPIRLSFGLEY